MRSRTRRILREKADCKQSTGLSLSLTFVSSRRKAVIGLCATRIL